MRRFLHLMLLAALPASAMVSAAPAQAAPLPGEVRLSDEEKEKVLEAAAAGRLEQSAPMPEKLPPEIHGEVGFSIGTGGYRSAYGTAVVPLEGDGVAIISLGSTDFGKRDRYIDPWWR